MSKKPIEPNTLRAEAEATEAQHHHTYGTALLSPTEELQHELRVFKIELEMQNEELQRSYLTLEESHDRYVDLYDFAPVGYLLLNREGLITEINLTAAGLLGEDRKELLHRRFATFITPKDGDYWYLFFSDLMRHNEKKNIELELKRSNDTKFPVQLVCLRMNSTLRIALTDISERKHQEQQENKRLAELAHITRLGLMGEMASGIAHEVNQPLTAISSYTQVSLNLINTETPDLVKLSEILYKTQQQALRAGHIIHHMKEFVKSHAKHRSAADINHLIHEAVSLCIAELKQNSIKLTFELENNLPPVYVDHIQIEQVIINLIRNSADALHNLPAKQQRQLTIYTHLTTSNCIQVRVKDNGSGINEDQQQKILTPFYTTKTDGMGMGLSISRSLIEAHEGTLHFNSASGKGSTFYFTLPIQKKSEKR